MISDDREHMSVFNNKRLTHCRSHSQKNHHYDYKLLAVIMYI